MSNESGLRIINDLEARYKKSYRIAYLSVIGIIAISITAMFLYYKMLNSVVQNKMIIVASEYGNTQLIDKQSQILAHVKNFHKLFFQLDEYNYISNLKEALHLISNKDGTRLVNTYSSNDFYKQIQSNNLSIGLIVDTIVFERYDPKNDVYKILLYGTQKVRSKNTIQERKLITEMSLKSTTNSTLNPFGYMIYDFMIKDNKNTIKTNLDGEIISEL